jgi:hypothetical protein
MRHDTHRFPSGTALAHVASGFAAAATLLATPASAEVTKYRVIAVTDEVAPGTGSSFDDLGGPVINLGGQVAFLAVLANGDVVLYRTVYDDPAALELIVRSGDEIPGPPYDVVFQGEGTAHRVVLNDDGDLAFDMTVGNLNEAWLSAVFRLVDGTLETIALPGRQVPGAPAGVEYANIGRPYMNAYGSVAFRTSLQGTGVNATNDEAMMTTGFGGLQMLARSGAPAPGREGDTLGSLWGGLIADNGRVAFWSDLNGDNDQGSLWTGWPGLLDTTVVAGEGVPNVGGLLNYSVNNDGVVFTTYAPLAHMRDIGNGIEQTAVVGNAGPIGTYEYVNEFHGNTNASGALLFAARFAGPGDDFDSAIIQVSPGGQQTVVVREGDPAPGYWNNVEIDHVGNYAASRVAFDNAGRLYYRVPLRGAAITGSNDGVLYARDLDGTVDDLMRKGQIMEVREGDYRIVQDFYFHDGAGTQAGQRGGVNDAGDLAMSVVFNDGSEAIVVAQLGQFCAGDFNHDGYINVDDLVIVILNWGQTTAPGTDGDTDRNGVVDADDLVELILSWGVCA